MTFAEQIEEAANGPIIGVVFGADQEWREKLPPDGVEAGEVVSWELARPVLDYEYDAGFGSPECHPVVAWSDERVVFVGEYDGSTGVGWLPRNPTTFAASFI